MAVVKTKRGRPGVWWGSKMGTLNIVMKIHVECIDCADIE